MPDLAALLLYAFCGLAVLGGLGVLVLKNPLHAAVSLLFTMIALGAAYAALGAHVLAALQILIYAGAIVILIVYVVMLLDLGREELHQPVEQSALLFGMPIFVLLSALAAPAMMKVPEPRLPASAACASGTCETACADWKDDDGDKLIDCADSDCHGGEACFGTVRAVGATLLGPFVLPFEAASVLLLAGIAAAVLLTGRRPKELADRIPMPATDAEAETP